MWIELFNLTSNRRESVGRFALRPRDQRGDSNVDLFCRSEDERLRSFAEASIFTILHNPNHLNERVIAARKTEAFADGVFTGPEAAGKGFIDDRDAQRFFIILLGEIAPLEQTRA